MTSALVRSSGWPVSKVCSVRAGAVAVWAFLVGGQHSVGAPFLHLRFPDGSGRLYLLLVW